MSRKKPTERGPGSLGTHISRGHSHNRIFAVVQFEYTTKNWVGDDMYGKLPLPIAVLTLEQ